MKKTAKQRMCSKLGITESQLKANDFFSENTTKRCSSDFDFLKHNKGEQVIKALSTATEKKKNSIGTSAYQNYRIDLLVPNTEPPKPLISLDSLKNSKLRSQTDGPFLLASPIKTTHNFNSMNSMSTKNSSKINNSHLESLNDNLKLNKTEIYSPVLKVQSKNQEKMDGKFLIVATLNTKKEGLLDLLWDKKEKINVQMNTISSNRTKTSFIKKQELPTTRREINLLYGRLNKIFPTKK